jgi:TonB family protein
MKRILAIALLLAPMIASADTAVQTGSPPRTNLPELVSHPSLDPVQRAMDTTNLGKLEFTVEVQWDAEGRVTDARTLERVPSATVETAALDWARALRFESGKAGKGRIPFKLNNDGRGGGHAPWPVKSPTP